MREGRPGNRPDPEQNNKKTHTTNKYKHINTHADKHKHTHLTGSKSGGPAFVHTSMYSLPCLTILSYMGENHI